MDGIQMVGKPEKKKSVYEDPISKRYKNDKISTDPTVASFTGSITPKWMKIWHSTMALLLLLVLIFNVIIAVQFTALSINKKAKASTNSTRIEDDLEKNPTSTKLSPQEDHRDCASWRAEGYDEDGVYLIDLENNAQSAVFCDMSTDGGGWTVIQRRRNGNVDFYRKWLDYQSFFGEVNGNYWFGLESISFMTLRDLQQLYIKLEDHSNKTYTAKYSTFMVGPINSRFVLTVSGYNGTAGDSLDNQNGQAFSTYDRDTDRDRLRNCASKFHGAWWYNNCYSSNLNGQYHTSAHTDVKYMCWLGVGSNYEALKSSVMMIRPASWSK